MDPFTSADAASRGITRAQLRSRKYRRVFRDAYVDSATSDSLEVRARAALLIHPEGAVVSHTTAARLLGLPVDDTSLDVHVTVTRDSHRRRSPGIVNHVGATSSSQVGSVRMATGVDLFRQLASMLGLVELVVAGDAMVRRGQVTPDDLRRAHRRPRGRVGRLAQRAARLVRDEVDSPMETRLRLLLVLAGFPEPIINHKIHNEYGDVIWRFDLCYLALRLIIEYDGRQHREDLDQWDTDIGRREWFDLNDWRLIVVVARDIYRRPEVLLDRVADAIEDRGGSRPEIDAAWREYFTPPRSGPSRR